jgi:hypothetical protein
MVALQIEGQGTRIELSATFSEQCVHRGPDHA